MVSKLTFEPMRSSDLARVMEIERLAFRSPWTAGLFLHELKLAFSRIEVVRPRPEEPIAGYVCWWKVADEVHILNLAVHPNSRRMGLGRALVERVVCDATASNAGMIGLEVRPGNEAALGLYGALGFEVAGRRVNYYGTGEDAIIMDRTLGATALDNRVFEPA
jgi:ribosomal-protein-alanine N-acetyltransferase